jgi:serine/threonine protein kinase/WD40 repeat protein
MPLPAQSRFGAYEILSLLGAGGMGEVYKARDTRLNRRVAIKVLPEAFVLDTERLARFEREAKVLASLNHANIAQIYGMEDRALIIEFVEGRTLADRISQGALPIGEALAIAKQIADALEYAHDRGIVHRDLKPENIKTTADGVVKVLDFGLAKAVEAQGQASDPSVSPTLTMRHTQAGVILGTAAYMAPEQARGKTVDRRADIWAFGAVLYEMLTGKRAFEGETISDVLAAVLTQEPRFDLAPARLHRLLRLCLEKDPKKRLHDISAFDLLLTESSVRVSRPVAWMITSAVLAVLLAGSLFWPREQRKFRDGRLLRLHLDTGPVATSPTNVGPNVVLSPDGTRVVYVANTDIGVRRLYTRRLDEDASRELPGTDGAHGPFFSPDGNWVGFFAQRKLQKMSVSGGSPIVLCNAPLGRGGSWSEDGHIIAALSATGALSRIPVQGGAPVAFSKFEPGEMTHRWPQILPGGQGVLVTTHTNLSGFDNASIEIVQSPGNNKKTLHKGGTFGRYLQSGHITWLSRDGLFAAPFDVKRLELTGSHFRVFDDVEYSMLNGGGQFDCSQEGTAVYRRGRGDPGLRVVDAIDRSGKRSPLLKKPDNYFNPALSPDGRSLAVVLQPDTILVYDIQTGTSRRLMFSAVRSPLWTPDSSFLFVGSGGSLSWMRVHSDESPKAVEISKDFSNYVRPMSFTPDGKRLFYSIYSQRSSFDIWSVPVVAEEGNLRLGIPEVFLQTPADESGASVSPDGRWIAYHSNESGETETYVRALPGQAVKQVSSGGGLYPKWSRTRKELFFRTEDRLVVVPYDDKTGSFLPGKQQFVTKDITLAESFLSPNFDIAPDGTRAVVLLPAQASGAATRTGPVNILLNFFDEVYRRSRQ